MPPPRWRAFAGPAPRPEPCARSGPGRDGDRGPGAAPLRRPTSPRRPRRPSALEAQIDGEQPSAPTCSTSSTCRRRTRSPTRTSRSPTASEASPTPGSRKRSCATRLGGRAALLYMGAGSGDPLGIDATNVQELGSRAKYGEAAAETDNRMIDQLGVARRAAPASRPPDLEKQKADAQKRQKRRRHGAPPGRAAINDADAAAARLDEVRHPRRWRTRSSSSKLAAEAAAANAARSRPQAARQAARRQRRRRRQRRCGSSTPVDTRHRSRHHPRAELAARRRPSRTPEPRSASRIVYAGAGPDSFDCSGLTMMAWAQGGVSMSHGSQSQWASFPQGADRPAPTGRPRVLRIVGPVEPPRRHLHRRRHDDRGAAHRRLRAATRRSTGPTSCRPGSRP